MLSEVTSELIAGVMLVITTPIAMLVNRWWRDDQWPGACDLPAELNPTGKSVTLAHTLGYK